MKFEDIDEDIDIDDEGKRSSPFVIIDPYIILDIDYEKQIIKCIMGNRKKLPESWEKQGFYFTKNNLLPYGLVQNTGGPCGIVGCVQAYVIKNLMKIGGLNDWKRGFDEYEIISKSLCDIIWKIGDDKKCSLCVPHGYKQYKIYTLTDKNTLLVYYILLLESNIIKYIFFYCSRW